MKNITLLVFAVVFTLMGLAGGYLATAKKAAEPVPAAAPDEHAEPHAEGPPKPKISAQALKNLGVTMAAAETKNFIRHREIPGTIVESPATLKPVLAPVAGRILKVDVVAGSVIAPEAALIQILRDPLPRPTYTLTDEILKFTNEDLHRTAAELRKAVGNANLAKTELERMTQVADAGGKDGPVLVPKKSLIDLRYDLVRAESELSNARLELKQHGLSAEEIAGLEAGKAIPAAGQTAWKHSFERNGLWTPAAESMQQALPDAVRNLPWNVAAIGELAATGLITADLVDWVKSHGALSAQFQHICGLVQLGHTIADLNALSDQSGFDATVTVKAPVSVLGGKDDWDVREVLAHAGEHVEAGARLLLLDNPRVMFLRVVPSGADATALLKANETDAAMNALPAIDGTGPALAELKIARFEGDEGAAGATALIAVRNEALRTSNGGIAGNTRSWRLRKGMRYMLRVPIQEFKDAFVVPNDAVTDDGPEKIILIQDGNSFKPLKVEILHLDHESAVIANNKDTEIFPGDMIVQHGTFGLNLALKASAGGGGEEGGEHAGHHHHHHH